jgi:outer membrane cobalamin receptor
MTSPNTGAPRNPARAENTRLFALLSLLLAIAFPAGALAQNSDFDAFPQSDSRYETTLPTVMVTGDRENLLDALSPGVVSIAKPDDVKGEHKSIPDLLDQIPGVYVRRQSGSAH